MCSDSHEVKQFPLRFHALAILGCLFITLVVFWPLCINLFTHLYSHDQYAWPGMGGDEVPFLWMYWWVQKALTEGRSLIMCDWVLPPTGANLVFRSIPFVPIIITYPLGYLLGPVAGNNIMVMIMIMAGAYAHSVFLSRGLGLSSWSSLLGGVLFGFSPYFVWKAGVHYNLMGAYAWGPVLAILFLSYTQNKFTRKRSILFAFMLWVTFWTSIIEFFMLGVVGGILVLTGEVLLLSRGHRNVLQRALFFGPSLLGLVSLSILLYSPAGHSIYVELWQGLSLYDLIPSAKLSVFSWLGFPNRSEVVFPHTIFWLLLPGIWLVSHKNSPALIISLVMLVFTLVLTVNPFELPSVMVRFMPMGGGFRIMERFFPFALFFSSILAGFGIEWGIGHWNGHLMKLKIRPFLAVLVVLFATCVYYPIYMGLSPVRDLNLSPQQYESLDRTSFLLVVPNQEYIHKPWLPVYKRPWDTIYDSYQVTLDMPAVFLTPWDHMSVTAQNERARDFPSLYGMRTIDPHAPSFFDELRALHVRYVLLPDGSSPDPFQGKTRVIHTTERETLLELLPRASDPPGNDPDRTSGDADASVAQP